MFKLKYLLPLPLFLLISFSLNAKPMNNIQISSKISSSDLEFFSNEFKLPLSNKELDFIRNYNKKWYRLSSLEPSSLHWNQNIVVYINKNQDKYIKNHNSYLKWNEAVDADEDTDNITFEKYPQGTSILKEGHIVQNSQYIQPASINIMTKMENGYDQKYGNWKFTQISNEGKILLSGNSNNKNILATCIKCHQNVIERDHVFATINVKQ